MQRGLLHTSFPLQTTISFPPQRVSPPFCAFSLFMSIQPLIPYISIQSNEKKKNREVYSNVVKHGWCPWMFQLWRLCVVFPCCCACPVCRRLYLLPYPPTFLLLSSMVRC